MHSFEVDTRKRVKKLLLHIVLAKDNDREIKLVSENEGK